MIIINAVTEAAKKGTAATISEVWTLAQQYAIDFPQVIDSGKKMYKYATSTSITLPLQIGIDLRSMKIVQVKNGKVTKAEIEKYAASALGSSK